MHPWTGVSSLKKKKEKKRGILPRRLIQSNNGPCQFTLTGRNGSPLHVLDGGRLRSTKFFIAAFASHDTYTSRLQYYKILDLYLMHFKIYNYSEVWGFLPVFNVTIPNSFLLVTMAYPLMWFSSLLTSVKTPQSIDTRRINCNCNSFGYRVVCPKFDTLT